MRTVGELRRRLEGQRGGVDPEDLAELGEALGYAVQLSWADGEATGAYRAVFVRSSEPWPAIEPAGGVPNPEVNSPARRGRYVAWARSCGRTGSAGARSTWCRRRSPACRVCR